MKINLEFRMMKESDFSECARKFISAFSGEPWNEDWTYEQAYTRIDEMMASRMSRGYVVCDGEKIVSMCCGRIMTYLDFKELWIDEFFVDPEYQGQGIGSRMIELMRVKLLKENVRYMVLSTDKRYPAVKFYEKNEFEISESLVFMVNVI